MNLVARIAELEAQLEEARLRIADLEAVPDRPIWCEAFRLQPQQAQIFDALMSASDIASHVFVEDRIWPNGRIPYKAVDVQICRIRVALSRQGLPDVIETVWGLGWRIRPENRERIRRAAGIAQQPRGIAR